jgi:drug/metabolite transporter (DMT)-like permease
MFIQVLSKITSESLLSLYPIFVKKIGISSTLQLWSRLITYVAISAFFVDWSFIKSSIASLDAITLGLVNLSHIYFSYEGFRNLDSGVSFAIFNSYPLMILVLAGVLWNNSYLLVIFGLFMFIYGNHVEEKSLSSSSSLSSSLSSSSIDFYYGVAMILLAALTEAFIYFLVRRVKTTNNWNHVFISYFLGAVIMSAVVLFDWKDADKVRVGWSMAINGLIGSLGYFLRFYSSYRLDPAIYAPLSYFGVLMSYVYGILFDGETLNWQKVVGTVSILASNYFSSDNV